MLPEWFQKADREHRWETAEHGDGRISLCLDSCLVATITLARGNGDHTEVAVFLKHILNTWEYKAGWQRIDTLPAGWVLLWLVTADPQYSGCVHGQKAFGEPGKFWDGNSYRPLAWCSHWMPLPPGPGVNKRPELAPAKERG